MSGFAMLCRVDERVILRRATAPTIERVSDTPPEPAEARPWRPEDGPEPRVTVYPPGRGPGLAVWVGGRWQYAFVRARHDWADGRTAYHVDLALPGPHGHAESVRRAYWWPQTGLRVVHGPGDRRRRGSQAIDGT